MTALRARKTRGIKVA
ncbi:Putative uncharacterized protein [Lacticaseibacillus paracasei]|nr:Putative uncharacterized protein [Lacticaseibacillus paracasei]